MVPGAHTQQLQVARGPQGAMDACQWLHQPQQEAPHARGTAVGLQTLCAGGRRTVHRGLRTLCRRLLAEAGLGPPCAGKATQHTQCSSATQQLLCSTASLLHFTCCVALLHCVCCVASMADVCCCRALGTTMMSTTRSRRGKGVRASSVQRT